MEPPPPSPPPIHTDLLCRELKIKLRLVRDRPPGGVFHCRPFTPLGLFVISSREVLTLHVSAQSMSPVEIERTCLPASFFFLSGLTLESPLQAAQVLRAWQMGSKTGLGCLEGHHFMWLSSRVSLLFAQGWRKEREN